MMRSLSTLTDKSPANSRKVAVVQPQYVRVYIIIIIIIIKDIYIAPFRHAPKALCKKKVNC